jgi:hypothetical protein
MKYATGTPDPCAEQPEDPKRSSYARLSVGLFEISDQATAEVLSAQVDRPRKPAGTLDTQAASSFKAGHETDDKDPVFSLLGGENGITILDAALALVQSR